MHQLFVATGVVGFLIVLLSLFNRKIEGAPVTEPLIALVAGIAVGPEGLAWFHVAQWGEPTQMLNVACYLTLAMSLMAAALSMPKRWLRKNFSSELVLLFGSMLCMLLFSTLIIWGTGGFALVPALLLAAILTPTDPVVATAIVTGPVAERYMPARLRHSISFESGSNDGLALPLVVLPLLLLGDMDAPWRHWILHTVLYESALATGLGWASGYVIGRAFHTAMENGQVTARAFLSFSVALGFAVLGGMEAIAMNGIIGVFSCGVGLAWQLSRREDVEEEKVQEAIERLFTIPVFVIFGAVLPWHHFGEWGWRLWAIAGLILLFRRIPGILLLKRAIAPLHRWSEALFLGWFGPIGVAALFYATHAYAETGNRDYWTLPAATILVSTVAHGVSSFPLVRWMYGRAQRAH